MKTLNVYLVLVLVSLGKVFSQSELNVLTFNTPQGVFIQAGGNLNPASEISIERKAAGFERIALLKRPASRAELRANIEKSREIFGEYAPKTEDIDLAWEKFEAKDRQTITLIQTLPQLSFVFGFAYLDNKASDGNPTQYRISVNSLQKTVEATWTKNWPHEELFAGKTEVNEKHILLSIGTATSNPHLLRFEVQRKPISSGDFKAIDPVVAWNSASNTFVIIDTSLVFNGIYHYQITPGDLFGNRYPRQIMVKADNLPANLSFHVTKFEARNLPDVREVKLGWEIANPDLVQSVRLFKSNQLDGNYKPLVSFSPKENSWTDRIDIANELNFYRFEILDIFGRKHTSISFKHVYDLDIPATPVSEFSIENYQNLPRLRFTAGDGSTRGFYVYRKSGETGTFTQISDLLVAKSNRGEFIDSSAAFETQTLYYTVKAENDTYQKSEYSETLSFRDHLVHSQKTSLEPPYDITLRYENKQTLLFWENMNAKNPSIIGYLVYRKGDTEKEYTLLRKEVLPFTQNFYQDTLSPRFTAYEYAVQSVDVQGNKSILSQPQALDLTFEGRLLPQELGYEVSPTSIKINWTEISSPIALEVKIYRSENDGKPVFLGKSEPSKQVFTDTKVTRGKTYRYQLGVMDVSGNEELLRDIIIVSF